ncbi:Isy1-like splicing factor [Paraphysoderma sedebokerense]|nr:Isy1-like splicing factor [Paraphysoderma sedebokerense]
MARNEEKAQSMLYRFREVEMAELGLLKKDKRPRLASEVESLPEAERWRSQILREISKKVAKIQDPGLNDYQIRDLNDEINKLIREKGHWEYRIKQLGGPDYRKIAPRMLDSEGREVPGNRGYRYFGRAKELPGVKELFEEEEQEEHKKTRHELYKKVDADYYGYRDEDDGALVSYEAEVEERLYADHLAKMSNIPPTTSKEPTGDIDEILNSAVATSYVSYVPFIPSQKDVEDWMLRRRKQEIIDRYLGE